MEHFSYCFCISLIHSFWQAAILLGIYGIGKFLIRKIDPVSRRNALYFLLGTQVLLSCSTFYLYYTGNISFSQFAVSPVFKEIINSQSYIQFIAPWMAMGYLLTVIFKSIQLFINWNGFQSKSTRGWQKPSMELKMFTALKSFQFGIKRKVTLWYSNRITTPLTFGYFKPVILLPVALINNLSLEETETLIIHELTHIKNNDYFLNWLLIICETIYFFNPFVKMIADQVKLEREKNCDTHVLQFDYPAINYAETLLKAARFKQCNTPFILAAAIQNTQLFKRIQFFTKENNLQFYKRNYSAGIVVPIFFLFLLNNFVFDFLNGKKEISINPQPVAALSSISLGNDLQELTHSITTQPVSAIDARHATSIAAKVKPQSKTSKQLMAVKETAEVINENIIENYAMPVAVTEIDDTKDVTVTEENSVTGVSITKVYQMKLVNGEWLSTLKYALTECKSDIEVKLDSLNVKLDSMKMQLYILGQQ